MTNKQRKEAYHLHTYCNKTYAELAELFQVNKSTIREVIMNKQKELENKHKK